jgi:16S rRNA (uracil1498-N3)-methyltransferase
MHRFFIPHDWIGKNSVYFGESLAYQLYRVLRMEPGNHVILLDNEGYEYEVEISELRTKEGEGILKEKRPVISEPLVHITLFQALLKKDNFEWVLQKCTEVGVSEFVPMTTKRTIVSHDKELRADRIQRWERIITEAAEQSGRGKLPVLGDPVPFETIISQLHHFDCVLIPWEGETKLGVREVLDTEPAPRTVAIFIGPEGGFPPEEVEAAQAQGAIPVTLGPRILRAETAAVITTGLVLHDLDQM